MNEDPKWRVVRIVAALAVALIALVLSFGFFMIVADMPPDARSRSQGNPFVVAILCSIAACGFLVAGIATLEPADEKELHRSIWSFRLAAAVLLFTALIIFLIPEEEILSLLYVFLALIAFSLRKPVGRSS